MEIKSNLVAKYNVCHDALATLEDAITLLEETDEISKNKEYLAFQDSVIKRFEYSLDVLWKYIKDFLSEKKGVTVKSPKDTFREAFKQGLLNEQEAIVMLEMVDNRNETTHRYDLAKAKEMGKIIPKYYDLLIELFERTKP